MMDAETRLTEFLKSHDLELPSSPKAIGLYKPALVVGNMCFTSGHLPLKSDGAIYLGCVGKDVDQEAGFRAARQCGLAMLVSLKAQLGTLNRIQRVVKLLGMVNCVEGYTQQPAIINGCSELMAKIFGDDMGIGARSAIGVNALPMNASVEVEGSFLLNEV
jgi:enamine deaminase RidA (YjgF/YER057c/UK114 family)